MSLMACKNCKSLFGPTVFKCPSCGSTDVSRVSNFDMPKKETRADKDKKYFQLEGEINYLYHELNQIQLWLDDYMKRKNMNSPLDLLIDKATGYEDQQMKDKLKEAKSIVRKINYRKKRQAELQ